VLKGIVSRDEMKVGEILMRLPVKYLELVKNFQRSKQEL
jgi:hypothetical protein